MGVHFLLTQKSKEKQYHEHKAHEITRIIMEYQQQNKVVDGYEIINNYNTDERRTTFSARLIERKSIHMYLGLSQLDETEEKHAVCDYYGDKAQIIEINTYLQNSTADVLIFGKVGLFELSQGGFYPALLTRIQSKKDVVIVTREAMVTKIVETFSISDYTSEHI